MVLVGQDGVQRPAIHLPAGGHLLAFLTCLETGLQPHGRLDPPLWHEEGKGDSFSLLSKSRFAIEDYYITGKVFPKIKRRLPVVNNKQGDADSNGNGCNVEDDETIESTDYVFRIIANLDNNFATEQNSGECWRSESVLERPASFS